MPTPRRVEEQVDLCINALEAILLVEERSPETKKGIVNVQAMWSRMHCFEVGTDIAGNHQVYKGYV